MAFNQIKYIDNYNKNTYKMFPLRVRLDSDKIIEKLKSVPSVNKYIINLIRKDIYPEILTIKKIKEIILPILNKHNIFEIYLFGSYSRGEANIDSDLDIYCESGDIKSLIEQGLLEDELERELGKKVDVVFIGSIMDDFFREQLERDKIKI